MSTAGRPQPPAHIAAIVYRYLTSGNHSLPQVARRAGYSEDMLGKVSRRERALPLELVPRLYAATGDLGFYGELVGAGDVGVLLHARPMPGVVPVADLRSAMMGATAALGRLAADAESALADDTIDLGERIKLEQDLDDMARQVETIRARVKQAPTPLVRRSAR